MVSRIPTGNRGQGNGIEQSASSHATEATPWLGVNLPYGHWLPSSARSVVSRASSLLGGLANFRWGGPSASARPAPNIRSAAIAPAQQTLPPELWQQIATLAGARPRRAMREVSLELRNASRAVVTHLTISDPAMFRQLSLYPALKSVRFKGALTLEALKALPPTLEHLEIGRCTGSAISAEGLAHLAAMPLKSLNLNGIEIGVEGARLLATSTSLASLSLMGCDIGDRAATALAASSSIQCLDLSVNRIGRDGAQALAGAPLVSLNLHNNEIGNEGARALATSRTLTSLDVSNNGVGNAGAEAFAGNTVLKQLSLAGGMISGDGAQALADNKSLTDLDLSNNRLGDAGAQALADSESFVSLKLGGNEIGADGAEALARNVVLNLSI